MFRFLIISFSKGCFFYLEICVNNYKKTHDKFVKIVKKSILQGKEISLNE